MTYIASFHLPHTIIGPGSIKDLGDIAKDYGASNVLIITDKGVIEAGLIEKAEESLKNAGLKTGIFDGCQPNAPSNSIHECSKEVSKGNYDLLVGMGGGSVMDSTKAVSVVAASGKKVQDFLGPGKMVTDVFPKILVPTTSGTGSEWSHIAIITDSDDGKKKPMGPAPYIQPSAAVVDSELTLNLPPKITAETGIDALSHAIESYVNRNSSVINEMFAETTIKLISRNLRKAYSEGSNDIKARNNMSIAATLSVGALRSAGGPGLAHLLDGIIVEKAGISHGAAIGILLPYVMDFNLIAAPRKFARIANLMGEDKNGMSVMDDAGKAVTAVKKLCKDLEMPQNLREVGISEKDIAGLVDGFGPYYLKMANELNPRDVKKEDVKRIFKEAL